MKPDCYKCQWRDDLPGSAHSCCNHPLLNGIADNPLGQFLGIMASVQRLPAMQAGTEKLGVKGNPIGIRRGWFNFPWNYDPAWLDACNGFTQKETEHREKVEGGYDKT